MRTDCNVSMYGELRLQNIPLCYPGRDAFAKRGSFIEFKYPSEGYSRLGRVIGIVTAEDLEEPHLCVLMFCRGTLFERWVQVEWVVDCWSDHGIEETQEKLKWFFSNEFYNTPPDAARQAYDKLADDLRTPFMPQTYGQGPHPSHVDNPQHDILTAKQWQYSHTTMVTRMSGKQHMYHTYRSTINPEWVAGFYHGAFDSTKFSRSGSGRETTVPLSQLKDYTNYQTSRLQRMKDKIEENQKKYSKDSPVGG